MSAKKQSLSEEILEYTSGRSEGSPVTAKELLHLGNRAAVDQALSRLARRGRLLRTGRGLYVRPVEGRFGTRPPAAAAVAAAIAQKRGEKIVLQGAAAANSLGLTTQVPVREVYLTGGRSLTLKVGAQKIEFRHVSPWRRVLPGQPAGEVVRALGWLGQQQAHNVFKKLAGGLQESEREALISVRADLPGWMAEEVSALANHG